MYTTKEQADSFLQHRELLLNKLLERAVKNNVKVAVVHCGTRINKRYALIYNIGGINLIFDCTKTEYSYARKSLSKKIKTQRIAKLAEEIRKVRLTYHDGQDIIKDAILASRRNY
jgi:coenzyme F420-reducing hydrogenase delta subunit